MAFYRLKGNEKKVEAHGAAEALEKLRLLITYGPVSTQDWMEKSQKTHPHIRTDSPEVFLAGLIEHGYVIHG